MDNINHFKSVWNSRKQGYSHTDIFTFENKEYYIKRVLGSTSINLYTNKGKGKSHLWVNIFTFDWIK